MINIHECISEAEDIEIINGNSLLIVGKKKNILLTGLSLEFIGECYEVFGNKFRRVKQKNVTYQKIVWTNAEIKYLKENYLKEKIDKISSTINKSNYQINLMLSKLNLIEKRPWSEWEIDFLKNNIKNSTVWLAGELRRSVASIKAKKRILRSL